jgi:hypothetical protein
LAAKSHTRLVTDAPQDLLPAYDTLDVRAVQSADHEIGDSHLFSLGIYQWLNQSAAKKGGCHQFRVATLRLKYAAANRKMQCRRGMFRPTFRVAT